MCALRGDQQVAPNGFVLPTAGARCFSKLPNRPNDNSAVHFSRVFPNLRTVNRRENGTTESDANGNYPGLRPDNNRVLSIDGRKPHSPHNRAGKVTLTATEGAARAAHAWRSARRVVRNQFSEVSRKPVLQGLEWGGIDVIEREIRTKMIIALRATRARRAAQADGRSRGALLVQSEALVLLAVLVPELGLLVG